MTQYKFRTKEYIAYLWRAKSRFWLHSPFVYEMMTNVVIGKNSDIGKKINHLRNNQLKSQQIVQIEDFGAGYGGKMKPKLTKTLAQIVKSSARNRKTGEFLLRFCQFYQPTNALELGGNVGFSAAYQASGLENNFLSIEGSSELVQIANENLNYLNIIGCEFKVATFQDYLSQMTNERFDYVFLDGHHTYKSTLNYVHQLLPRMNPNSFIILDDIYWSPDMNSAWEALIQLNNVTVSLDLYYFGILCFDRPQAKQHFTLLF